jgi:hypothetical protein
MFALLRILPRRRSRVWRFRQAMWRRIMLAYSLWGLGWSVPSRVKERSALHWASILVGT